MFLLQYGFLLYIVFAIFIVVSPIIIVVQLSKITSLLREIARRLPPPPRP